MLAAPAANAQYVVSSIPYNPNPYNTGTPILVNIDDTWSNAITLPFTFNFFGVDYTQLIIGSNGLISFDMTNAGGYCPWSYTASLPSSSLPLNAIYSPYHDIDPSVAGTLYYSITGAYPNRKFVASFYNIAMYSSTCNNLFATQQIVLYESSNIIDVFVQDAPLCITWNSGNKCIGIQNSTGTVGFCPPGRNTGAWSATNEAWRFGPLGPAPDIFTNHNITLCSSSATISANSGFSQYLWSTGDTTQSINVVSSGIYGITATYNGTNFTDSVHVLLTQPYLNLNLGNDTLICGGASITLDAGNNFTHYTWNTGSLNQSINVNQTGLYNVVVTDTALCSYTDTVKVIINPSVSLDLGNDTSLCNYGTYLLDASVAFDSYQWSTGDTSQTISPDTSGMYYVTATNYQCSVTATDSVNITFHAVPVANAGPDSFICQGSSVLLNASGGASYLWSPDSALTCTACANPQASPLSSTTYIVTVTNSNGCSASDAININVETISISSTNSSCGLSNGTAAVTLSGGSGPFTYSWSTVPAQADSIALNLSPGTYTCTVSDVSLGCSMHSTIIINSTPLPSIILNNIVNANCGMNNGSITTTVSGGFLQYSYAWNSSPQQFTQDLVNVAPGNYCVTLTDGNGCKDTACGTIQAIVYDAPEICMVTVDTSTNYNLVIWEKPVTTGIDKYYIFRETSVSGVYNLIGTQNYSDISTFTDITSNSLQQSYRYELAIHDNCGLTSQQSAYHQTMHLTIYAGMGGSWNLNWNGYGGFTFNTYNIYRGTNPGNLTLLNSVSSNVTSYSDMTPPTGTVYYLIEVVKPAACNPSFKTTNDFSSTLSNIASSDGLGIAEINNNDNIQVFPNPGNGLFTITLKGNVNNAEMEVVNSLGQIVYSDILNGNTKTIDVSDISKGIYFIEVNSGDSIIRKKFIKE